MRQREHTMREDTELHLYVLSAELRISTNSWKQKSQDSSEQMTQFFTLPASMQTEDYLKQS